MPSKPLRPCGHTGCPNLTTGRYCEAHAKQAWQQYDHQRGSASSRGYGRSWQKVRQRVLTTEPLCRRCKAAGIAAQADVVHHIDRNPKNNDWVNLEPLCVACHEAEHKSERWGRGGLNP